MNDKDAVLGDCGLTFHVEPSDSGNVWFATCDQVRGMIGVGVTREAAIAQISTCWSDLRRAYELDEKGKLGVEA